MRLDPAPVRGPLARWARRLGLAFAALIGLFLFLTVLWRFAPPVSTLMLGRYLTLRPVERQWRPLEQISPFLVAAVISSEDGRFCRHHGVDWEALREVLDDAGEGGPTRGASTLSMQTAKNLFLWPWRSYVRKALELPIAIVIDFAWPKRRIMEIYLNVAEWGEGLFGAEAAARRYFGKPASALTPREAALMATALPNPILRNPSKPTRRHANLARLIERRAAKAGEYVGCVK